MLGNYFAVMEIDDKELRSIYEEFNEAKNKMADCMRRLEDIGLLRIKNVTDSLDDLESVAGNETTTDKTEKGSYIPFHNDALKMARDDEKLIADAFVKTEGFDKSIVFFMSLCEQIWHVANKYKNFRMELFYDAEALNTNYAFFVPSTQSESDDKCPESLKNQD